MPTDHETPGQSSQIREGEAGRVRASGAPSADARLRGRVISLGRFAIAGLACLPLLLFALLFARFVSGQRALTGVSIGGVDVSGASAGELHQVLSERAAQLAHQRLTLQLGGKRASVSLEELGVSLAVADSTRRALGVARDAGWLSGALRYLRSSWTKEALPAALRVDRQRFDQALTRLQPSLIDDPPFPGTVSVENGVARALPPRPGRKLVGDEALRAVSEAVARGLVQAPVVLHASEEVPKLVPGSLERALEQARRALAQRVVLEAGARRLELEPVELGALLVCRVTEDVPTIGIDADRFEAWLAPRRASLEAPPREATFEVSATDEVKVVAGAAGVKLVTEAVSQALWVAAQSDSRRAELPLLSEPPPARSTEQAEALGIRRMVGAFTTRHPCCQPRVENIHRVAALLDGLVVEPGQQVSVNAVVGPRTLKNGFVLAPSIEDGEMIDTIGGGVSQFATTLFNALFRAGYEILERKPHTYWFPRYPMGIEATLSWPRPDLVFKNDTSAGLLVKTSFTDKSITVKLYGDVGGRRVATSVSERRDIVKPTVELLPNRAVPPDEEEVKEGGMIGWSVLVERTVTFADGSKREDKRKVTYKPKPRRVEVHPCRIPKGEPGSSGEPCPEPEPEPEEEAAAEPAAQPG
jgi:vancomycin resistance protein YoaR